MKFYVNYISPTESKHGSHQVLFTVLGTVPVELRVERDPVANPVFCTWLPTSQLKTYQGFLDTAKAAGKKFVLEAEVARIKAMPAFTNKRGIVTQDIIFVFTGPVTKFIEVDAAVIW